MFFAPSRELVALISRNFLEGVQSLVEGVESLVEGVQKFIEVDQRLIEVDQKFIEVGERFPEAAKCLLYFNKLSPEPFWKRGFTRL